MYDERSRQARQGQIMSIETNIDKQQVEQAGACTAIDLMIYPKEHDLGGFTVRRALPAGKRRMVGPWIFFDHMGPAVFEPGKGIDVRPHPHINLATVTYLFEGEMLHRDSLGNELAIKPGEINLMVAGRGIVHSERQREAVKAADNVLDGLQLWLALPDADEEIEPAFHHYDHEQLPSLTVDGAAVRVLIGSAYGVQSPVRTFARTLYVEAALKAGQSLTLPDGVDERALYVVKGRLMALESVIDQFSMAVLHKGHTVTVYAVEDTQLALIGGEPLGPRYIWWNFVSSRKERIEQAKADWKNGAFPRVPGDEVEFIPLPEK
jgi:redox-sensitive bicupin YhaK (pirin superfamily)